MIVRCLNCGEKGVVYKGDDMRRPYYVQCQSCEKRSNGYSHIDFAVNDWNERNKPGKRKPTYHCGNCGAEVILGFSVCTKCGTEIEW